MSDTNTKATNKTNVTNNDVTKKEMEKNKDMKTNNAVTANTNVTNNEVITTTPVASTPVATQATTDVKTVKITKKDKKYSIDELLEGSLNFLFKDVTKKILPIVATKNDFTGDVWSTIQTLQKINHVSITEIKPLSIKAQLEEAKKVNDKLSQELGLVITKNNSLLISNQQLASDYETLKKRCEELQHNYNCEQLANSNLRKELKSYIEKLKAVTPTTNNATPEPTPEPTPTTPTTQSQNFKGLTIPKGLNNNSTNGSSNASEAFSLHKRNEIELKPTCVVSYRLHEKRGYYMLSFKFNSFKASKEARSNFLYDCKQELLNFDSSCKFTWYNHNEILISDTSISLQDSRYISIIINVLEQYISHGVQGFKDIVIEYK